MGAGKVQPGGGQRREAPEVACGSGVGAGLPGLSTSEVGSCHRRPLGLFRSTHSAGLAQPSLPGCPRTGIAQAPASQLLSAPLLSSTARPLSPPSVSRADPPLQGRPEGAHAGPTAADVSSHLEGSAALRGGGRCWEINQEAESHWGVSPPVVCAAAGERRPGGSGPRPRQWHSCSYLSQCVDGA